MDRLISLRAAIDVEGIDEQIRCEMCGNPMHTDRGCDGNCKYDEKLYERIMQILGERIKPLPSAQPDPSQTARDIATIIENEKDMRAMLAQPEIIACADCKHWICHDRRCGYWNHGVKPLDWCCHAERRTDEQTISE